MKNLRRLALSRIGDDAVLSRQYRLAAGGWSRKFLKVLGSWCVLPVSVVLIGLLTTFLGVVLGGGIQRARADVYYLVIAVIGVIIAMTHTGWVLRELIHSRSLAVVSMLPVPDRDFAASRLVSSLQKTLLFLAGSLLFGAGIAFGAELNALESVQILFLSIALWAMVASLSVIVPAFLPVVIRQETASMAVGFVTLLSTAGVILTEMGLVPQGFLVSAALTALPTGWPVLMIQNGVMLKQPDAWWLLVPTGGVLVLAFVGYARLLTRYQVQEFTFEPGSLATARFRSHHRSTKPADRVSSNNTAARREQTNWILAVHRHLRRWLQLSDADVDQAELSRDQAIARIRETGLTRSFDWSRAGLIERALARLLRDEELQAAEILSADEPQWSAGMAWSLGTATAAIALVVAIAIAVNQKIAMVSGHIGFFGVFGVLAGSGLAAIWRSANGDSCAALAIQPVDARHAARTSVTLGALRSIFVLPFVTGVVLIIQWGHGGQLEIMDSVLLGARVALTFTALHQWAPLFMLPYAYSKPIGQTIVDIVAGVVIGCSTIAGAGLLLMSGHSEWLAATGAGLLFGSGWVAQQMHQRRIQDSPTDFVIQLNAQRLAVQNQQKKKQAPEGPVFWPRPVAPSGPP